MADFMIVQTINLRAFMKPIGEAATMKILKMATRDMAEMITWNTEEIITIIKVSLCYNNSSVHHEKLTIDKLLTLLYDVSEMECILFS